MLFLTEKSVSALEDISVSIFHLSIIKKRLLSFLSISSLLVFGKQKSSHNSFRLVEAEKIFRNLIVLPFIGCKNNLLMAIVAKPKGSLRSKDMSIAQLF